MSRQHRQESRSCQDDKRRQAQVGGRPQRAGFLEDQDASPDVAGDKNVCTTTVNLCFVQLLLETMVQGQRKTLELHVWVENPSTGRRFKAVALVDTGASGIFVDKKFAKANWLELEDLPEPVPV